MQVRKQKIIKNAVSKMKAKAKIKPKKIMIVAGHGYSDPGAVGNGTNERDFIRKTSHTSCCELFTTIRPRSSLYGGTKQSQDMYQDTAYGQNVGNRSDYGMYWVKNKNTIL